MGNFFPSSVGLRDHLEPKIGLLFKRFDPLCANFYWTRKVLGYNIRQNRLFSDYFSVKAPRNNVKFKNNYFYEFYETCITRPHPRIFLRAPTTSVTRRSWSITNMILCGSCLALNGITGPLYWVGDGKL